MFAPLLCLLALAAVGIRAENVIPTDIKDLGAPELVVRKAALEKIKLKKEKYLPTLLALMHPKQLIDEYTRIGILRALAALAPLTEQGSRVLAFVAVHDPYGEVRREACCVIRNLGNNAAMRELLKYAGSEDANLRRAVAIALREIDDPRPLAALIRAIPPPSGNVDLGLPTNIEKPKYLLPIGLCGVKIPIWLPTQDIAGTVTNIDSPAAQLLKMIAGKDLGSFFGTWYNWYREKIGEITASERNSYLDHRSMRNRMGVPPPWLSYP
ncbi:MAG: HEAT repeat domain-containing protein [Planctomycetota bacterium]